MVDLANYVGHAHIINTLVKRESSMIGGKKMWEGKKYILCGQGT
jgi:hypothetical protein